MTKIACFSSGDRISFDHDDAWDSELIYSSACHTVARYIVENSEMLDEVLAYLSLDEETEADFRSRNKCHQAEDLGEYLYYDENWVTVEED